MHEFQQLRVYRLALDYTDEIYRVASALSECEKFNLRAQLERAATSIVLNIAEGSTSQSDPEQQRFLGMAIRSYLETVACPDLIERRGYALPADLGKLQEIGAGLFMQLQAFRKRLGSPRGPR
jgi:four helix bundle protein